jgi:hypothetical protein
MNDLHNCPDCGKPCQCHLEGDGWEGWCTHCLLSDEEEEE